MKTHYKTIAFWSITAIYLIVVLSFVGRKVDQEYCVSVDLRMEGKAANYFIDKHDVLEIIKENTGEVLGRHMGEIDVREIEKVLEIHSSIKNAEVYKQAGNIVKIRIEQRNPILRVIDKHNKSFYIDDEGFVMSVSKKFTARVPVANGNIAVDWNKLHNNYVHKVIQTKDSTEAKPIYDLFVLSNFISQQPFWSKQIQQIYVNKDGEIEMIPRIGAHIIILGNIKNYENKFRNLRAVYNKAFKAIGWNQYRTINLKFNNQVICTKRTP